MASKLQIIARQCNWLLGFTIKTIHLPMHRGYSLELSSKTHDLASKINRDIAELRFLIRLDWQRQREEIKKEQAKEATAQLSKMVGDRKDNPPPTEY